MFNRRQIVEQLLAGSLLGQFVTASAGDGRPDGPAWSADAKQLGPSNYVWHIARKQSPVTHNNTVDFWSMPGCQVNYADYLSGKIVRCVLWHEPRTAGLHAPQSGPIATTPWGEWSKTSFFDGTNLREASCSFESLPAILQSFSGPDQSRHTAIIAINSDPIVGTNVGWADLLPLFRASYQRIIGHIHCEGRGIRQVKQAGSRKSYLEMASYCDAVIFTSSSQIENDPGLSISASTEDLAGELVGRLSDAILDSHIADVVAANKNGQPRFLALSSITLPERHANALIMSNWYRYLPRHAAMVKSCFGDLICDDLPIFVATAFDYEARRPEIVSEALGKIVHRTAHYDSWIDAERIGRRSPMFWITENEPFKGITEYGSLELIALWPFEFST